MCKKREEIKKEYGWFKRLIIALAFWFLKPKCEQCDGNDNCTYYDVTKKREV